MVWLFALWLTFDRWSTTVVMNELLLRSKGGEGLDEGLDPSCSGVHGVGKGGVAGEGNAVLRSLNSRQTVDPPGRSTFSNTTPANCIFDPFCSYLAFNVFTLFTSVALLRGSHRSAHNTTHRERSSDWG